MAFDTSTIVPAIVCVVVILIGGALIMWIALNWQNMKLFGRKKSQDDEEAQWSQEKKKTWPHSRESSWDSTTNNSPPQTSSTHNPAFPPAVVRN